MIHEPDKLSDDDDLLLKLKTGDKKAFEEVFNRYYSSLVFFAVTFLNDKDLAESIVQAVFVKLWEKRTRLEIRSLKSYLMVSARNRCHNELKRQGVIRTFKKSNKTKTEEWPQFREELYLKKIYSVIEELPPARQKILKMKLIDGLKYKEIAEKLSISPKTVEVQMGKALKYLREKLMPLKDQILNS